MSALPSLVSSLIIQVNGRSIVDRRIDRAALFVQRSIRSMASSDGSFNRRRLSSRNQNQLCATLTLSSVHASKVHQQLNSS